MTLKRLMALGVPVVTLAVGISIGSLLQKPAEPAPPVCMAPISMQDLSRDGLVWACTHNSAYDDLSKGDRYTHKALRVDSIRAEALSDRGVTCLIDGSLEVVTERGSGTLLKRVEPIHQMILVSATGESEPVSEEFMAAMKGSRVVRSMATNTGNGCK